MKINVENINEEIQTARPSLKKIQSNNMKAI
jgi:hypothetical protein